VRRWDVATGKETARWEFPHAIMRLSLSRDGTTLAIGHNAPKVSIWDVGKAETVQTVKGPDRALAISPDGRLLAGAAPNSGLRLWDARTGKEVLQFGLPRVRFWVGEFSPDGRWLATGDLEGKVRLWDVKSGQEVRQFAGHTKWVRSVAFCDNGRKVLASAGDLKIPYQDGKKEFIGCAVLLWDRATGEEVTRWDTEQRIIHHLSAAPQGPRAVFASADRIQPVVLGAGSR
jgi:WD40 repeat protein